MTILRRFNLHLASRRYFGIRWYHPTTRIAADVVVGIRREDPERVWERRCPLTPDAVNELVGKEGVQVLIQECDRRVWATDDFLKACGHSLLLRYRRWWSVEILSRLVQSCIPPSRQHISYWALKRHRYMKCSQMLYLRLMVRLVLEHIWCFRIPSKGRCTTWNFSLSFSLPPNRISVKKLRDHLD